MWGLFFHLHCSVSGIVHLQHAVRGTSS